MCDSDSDDDWGEADDMVDVIDWLEDENVTATDMDLVEKTLDENAKAEDIAKAADYVRKRRASVEKTDELVKIDKRRRSILQPPKNKEDEVRLPGTPTPRATFKDDTGDFDTRPVKSDSKVFVGHRRTSLLETSKVTVGVDEKGHKLVNGYVIERCLGAGSFGKVKLCTKNGNEYAIKIIKRPRLKLRQSDNSTNPLRLEIAVLKKLRHPNVTYLHEVIDDPNCNKVYLVLEYVEGGALFSDDVAPKDMNKKSIWVEPFDEETCRRYTRDICKGLEYLHFQNIIHRDLKPANLLLTTEGRVKICDFGMSLIVKDVKKSITGDAGSPLFQAPEVCRGDDYAGPAADVWGLGATLYMMFFGRPPFVAEGVLKLFELIQETELNLPSTANPHLQDLLSRMMCKDPKSRITVQEIMKHNWITNCGTDPLKCTNFVRIDVSEEDKKTAFSSLDTLITILKIKKKVSKLVHNLRARIKKEQHEKVMAMQKRQDSFKFQNRRFSIGGPASHALFKMGGSFINPSLRNSFRIKNGDATLSEVEGPQSQFLQYAADDDGIGSCIDEEKNGGVNEDDIEADSLDFNLYAKSKTNNGRRGRRGTVGNVDLFDREFTHVLQEQAEIKEKMFSVEDAEDFIRDMGFDPQKLMPGTHGSKFTVESVNLKVDNTASTSNLASLQRLQNAGKKVARMTGVVSVFKAEQTKTLQRKGDFIILNNGFEKARDGTVNKKTFAIASQIDSFNPQPDGCKRIASGRFTLGKSTKRMGSSKRFKQRSKAKLLDENGNIRRTSSKSQFKKKTSSKKMIKEQKGTEVGELRRQSSKLAVEAQDKSLNGFVMPSHELDPKWRQSSENEINVVSGNARSMQGKVRGSVIGMPCDSDSSNVYLGSANLDPLHEEGTEVHSDDDSDIMGKEDILDYESGAESDYSTGTSDGSDYSDILTNDCGDDFDEGFEGEEILRSRIGSLSEGTDNLSMIFKEILLPPKDSMKRVSKVWSPENAEDVVDLSTIKVKGPNSHINPKLKILYSEAHEQGKRQSMEDASSCEPDLRYCVDVIKFAESKKVSLEDFNVGLFCVFDGHNGSEAASYLAEQFKKEFSTHPDLVVNTENAMKESTLNADRALLKYMEENNLFCGSTGAMMAIIESKDAEKPLKIVCGNVGDARIVLSLNGKAVELSRDHKISDKDEIERVIAAGGWITQGRLMGVLGVARSFGDIEYKTLKEKCWETKFVTDPLIAEPEIRSATVDEETEFAIIACDGIYDVMSSQAVVNFVRKELHNHHDADKAAKALVKCALDLESSDNCSVVLVCFRQSSDKVL